MPYNVDFDIAAFFICLIVLIINSGNRHLKTWQNKTFQWLLVCVTVSCVTDIIIVYVSYNWRDHLLIANMALNALHFSVFNSIPALYYLFVVTMAITYDSFSRKWKASVYIPYILTIALIIPASVTKALYAYDDAGIYHRQLCSTILYFIAFYYIIASLIVTIRHRHQFTVMQQAVAISFNVLTYAAMIVQFIFPQYLLMEFDCAICVVFIFLALQNPFDQKDFRSDSFNQKAFNIICPELISFKRSFTVISIKITSIKAVNEMFGSIAGNKTIEDFSNFLAHSLGRNTLSFHIRGPLFDVIVLDQSKTRAVIAFIANYLKKPAAVKGVKIETTGCVISLSYPENFSNFNDMLNIMTFAVGENETQPCFTVSKCDENLLKRKERDEQVGDALTEAVQKKLFDVHFQPVRSVETGKFESAEALARLTSAKIGRIAPDEFIAKAEKTAQIIALGDIILEKTCQFIRDSSLASLGIKNIKVNLSAIQCMQEGLAQRLISIIDDSGISHNLINFEITESIAVASDKNETFQHNIDLLRNAGFIFLLDDYGTGYSNISKLLTYQFGVVKMDKSIVQDAQTNPAMYTSLKYTTKMIKELRMKVLAEGVETESQAEMLKEIGIDYFQGYLYSQPLDTVNFLKFLEKNNK